MKPERLLDAAIAASCVLILLAASFWLGWVK